MPINYGVEVARATPLAIRFNLDNIWAGKGGKGGKAQNHPIHAPRAKGKGCKCGKDRDGGMADGVDRHTWALWVKFQEFAAGGAAKGGGKAVGKGLGKASPGGKGG